jgi:hypothetical protein
MVTREILGIGLLILFVCFVILVLGIVSVYWVLSWFNVPKLRELEAKRVKRLSINFRPVETRLREIESVRWLWYIRIATTIGLLPFAALILFAIYDLLIRQLSF